MTEAPAKAPARIAVRPATPADSAAIYGFIRDLAEYEKLLDEVTASEADIRRHLFGSSPRAFCDIAEADGAPVGFALWFYNYSTFAGRHGIYLEDLFVRQEARGWGPARRCSPTSRAAAWPRTWPGWSGRCSTGMRRPSPSTTRSGRGRWTNGPSAG